MSLRDRFDHFANKVADFVGQPLTWVGCCLLIVVWAASGPLLKFSDTWQLIVNTTTTIITFLVVFLIQNTQNRDAKALHAKLDELIRAQQDARESYVGMEHKPEREIESQRKDVETDAARSGGD